MVDYTLELTHKNNKKTVLKPFSFDYDIIHIDEPLWGFDYVHVTERGYGYVTEHYTNVDIDELFEVFVKKHSFLRRVEVKCIKCYCNDLSEIMEICSNMSLNMPLKSEIVSEGIMTGNVYNEDEGDVFLKYRLRNCVPNMIDDRGVVEIGMDFMDVILTPNYKTNNTLYGKCKLRSNSATNV